MKKPKNDLKQKKILYIKIKIKLRLKLTQFYHFRYFLQNLHLNTMKQPCRIDCRTAHKIPYQHNSTDCGVFICQYAECIALDIELMDFRANQIPDIRNQMKIEIATANILNHKHKYRQKKFKYSKKFKFF